jgi:hypothetical protein
MIGKKINQLATELAPATTDLTIIGDPVTGVSKKITLLQIADLFATSGTVTSVAVTETGNSLTITGSPITSAGTINIGFAGAANQYVRGDGQLSDFPTSTGGGSSVSYYLNSSVSQGTLGGVAYRQFSKTPIAGAGTDITISANGYIASYITDANDPALLEIPAGNFNCELYFSVNSNNHNPYVYAEVYKYDGTTFTLLGSSQSVPEYLTNGTTLSPYYFAVPITATVLTITDRIAIRIYANVDTKTVTLHTENSHLCQVVTTFSNGLTSLNNLTRQVQFLATGTSGTDFNIASSTATHTFNLPTASATNRGALSSADFTTFNNKQNALTLTTTGSSGAATLVGATLNIPNYGSALTGYVPYTGATANVNLGDFDLSSRSAYLEGTASYQAGLLIKQRGLYNFVTGAYTQIVADSATDLNIIHNQANTTRRRYALSVAALQDGDSFQYAVPRASGTIALTSNLAAYLPLAGGTMTGAIIGTTSTFTNAGSGVGVEITNSSTGDGLKINHSSGRALNIASSASGFGIIINNSTASTSAPFTIQKQGSNVITLSDNGAANFAGQLTLGSTITNGTNTFTLPSATGTLALTSALSGYLPLAGGTLTGALGGTSATFSSSVTAGVLSRIGDVYIGGRSGTYASYTDGVFGDNLHLGATSVGGAVYINTALSRNLIINPVGGNVGIGTSSISNALGTALQIGPTVNLMSYIGNAYYLNNWYYDSSGNAKYITSSFASGITQNGSGELRFFTNPSGTANATFTPAERLVITNSGNVGIGLTNPQSQLHINGDLTFTEAGYDTVRKHQIVHGHSDGNSANNNIRFLVSDGSGNTAERMRINGNGDLFLGTTTNDIGKLQIQTSGNGSSFSHSLLLKDNSTNQNAFLVSHKSGETRLMTTYSGSGINSDMTFWTTTSAGSQSERMRLNSNGNLTVYSAETTSIGAINSNNTNGNYGYYSEMGGNTNNTSSFHFVGAISGVGNKIQICGNGNVQNTNNSYGAISDISLKENIIDTTSKLADLLKVKIRNYNLIGDDKKQIGVIAQELETIFPSMVDTDTITGLKSVKYSVFVPMLIKAIQELNDKIK